MAHEGEHVELEKVNAALAEDPEAWELYIQRAQLHRLHEDCKAAAADLAIAEEHLPRSARLMVEKAAVAYQVGNYEDALIAVARGLEYRPIKVWKMLLLRRRAMTLEAMELVPEAVQAWTAYLEFRPNPKPEYFLRRAALQEPKAALEGLEAAMLRIGAAVSLELAAVDCEEKLGAIDAAHARLQRLADASPRKETWLFKQAQLLHRANLLVEAEARYRAALEAIESLTSAQQETFSMRRLREESERSLKEITF